MLPIYTGSMPHTSSAGGAVTWRCCISIPGTGEQQTHAPIFILASYYQRTGTAGYCPEIYEGQCEFFSWFVCWSGHEVRVCWLRRGNPVLWSAINAGSRAHDSLSWMVSS